MKRLVLLSLGCVACGDNFHPPRLVMNVEDAAPRYGRSPFPTDALRQGARLVRIEGIDSIVGLDDNADLVADHLAELDGFGLRPTVEFFFQGKLDPATIPATTRALDDSVFVLEVDPATVESGAPIAFDWRYDSDRNVVVGSPAMGVQLREGTRYAAVITKDVRNPDGLSVDAGIETGLLGQDPPERWRTTGEALAELQGIPGLSERIAGLTVFTTQNASEPLVDARNVIGNVAAVAAPVLQLADPALIFDTPAELDALLGDATRDTSGPRDGLERWGRDNPTGVAHAHIAVVATGTTTIARFIGDDTGTDGPDDETFAFGADGVPDVRATEEIPVTLVLPRGPVPANGFPVVIYTHGLGGSRFDMLAIAEPLAEAGYAVMAIDLWGHGSRFDATDTGNNLGAKEAFTGDRALRDGFGDNTGTSAYIDFFEGFRNFGAIRDKIRQSTLDVARLAILVRNNPNLEALDAPYATTPKLDPTKVAFLGESFGTIVGTNLAAIEPSIAMYVLNVPGGGLIDYIVPNSAAIGDLAVPLVENLYRTQGTLDRFHPLVGMLQAIFDPADSLTFARHVLRDRLRVENNFLGRRHVLAIEVMNDEAMPNVATEALARAFGLHVLRPNRTVPAGMMQIESPGSGNVVSQTGILVQYEPATHGFNWSAEQGTMTYVPGYPMTGDEPYPKLPAPITIDEPLYETWDQVTEALATYFASDEPLVRSTQTPVADFDGDGRLDNVDPDPYDPTR